MVLPGPNTSFVLSNWGGGALTFKVEGLLLSKDLMV